MIQGKEPLRRLRKLHHRRPARPAPPHKHPTKYNTYGSGRRLRRAGWHTKRCAQPRGAAKRPSTAQWGAEAPALFRRGGRQGRGPGGGALEGRDARARAGGSAQQRRGHRGRERGAVRGVVVAQLRLREAPGVAGAGRVAHRDPLAPPRPHGLRRRRPPACSARAAPLERRHAGAGNGHGARSAYQTGRGGTWCFPTEVSGARQHSSTLPTGGAARCAQTAHDSLALSQHTLPLGAPDSARIPATAAAKGPSAERTAMRR